MSSSSEEHASRDIARLVRRSYLKNAAYAFLVMFGLVMLGRVFPPFRTFGSYIQLVGYLIGGAAAGYYFSQDLDREKVSFQTKDGILLWVICAVCFVFAIASASAFDALLNSRAAGRSFVSALASLLGTGQATTTAASAVLGLLGIAMGRDIYQEQFTMLKPLTREKRVEVMQLASSVQPLVEARHRFGPRFTRDQLSSLLPGGMDRAPMEHTISDLERQGVLEVAGGIINVTSKGENLLSISRFVGGLRERGDEGAELCAYCGRPMRISDKAMRLNYYGKAYMMHYSEREGVRIFGRLPYVDRLLNLKPAEVARPAYEKPTVFATLDHKAAMMLGFLGAGLALASYTLMITRAEALPIASDVSFFSGTLLSVSLIFALCGMAGGLLTYLNPGSSYGGVMMLALLLFAAPFVGLTRQAVFGGYYAAVGLIAIGGLIAIKAHTRMA